jgi:hypothetical protein
MKYFLDCFQCGELQIEYDSYKGASDARIIHEENFQHFVSIEKKEESNESKNEV